MNSSGVGMRAGWMQGRRALSTVLALNKLGYYFCLFQLEVDDPRGATSTSYKELTEQRRQKLLFLQRSARHCLKGLWLQTEAPWLPEWITWMQKWRNVPASCNGSLWAVHAEENCHSHGEKWVMGNTQEQLVCKAATQNLSTLFYKSAQKYFFSLFLPFLAWKHCLKDTLP